ncbi:phospholipase D-like domain-containing protein [Moraxella bovoculi]|uniref:phospholipase D-like domain-containing protein n=1 Tax=Moraxella bovoculi TaxID=386891 RepID=UPI000AFB4F25|nr:phospholipase D-like domain-containing protein [Moraxella bovoculi]
MIVSPYFVPTRQGEEMLSELAQNGKTVKVLTNTLAANDVAVVHSAYAKYRKDLLQSGVKLYELKDDATVKPAAVRSAYDGQGASLHAKTFALDGRYLYVGFLIRIPVLPISTPRGGYSSTAQSLPKT